MALAQLLRQALVVALVLALPGAFLVEVVHRLPLRLSQHGVMVRWQAALLLRVIVQGTPQLLIQHLARAETAEMAGTQSFKDGK